MPCSVPSLRPVCSGFPPCIACAHLSDQVSPRLGAFQCLLSVWNTGSAFPVAHRHEPHIRCSLPNVCALCSIHGEGGVIFIFHRRWDLSTADSSQEHAPSLLYIFLYLAWVLARHCHRNSVPYSVEPLLHWVNWKGSGEHCLI